MNTGIFSLYYISVLTAFTVGVANYKQLSTSLRFIVVLLFITCISEIASYLSYMNGRYELRGAIHHIYNTIQAILLTAYFVFAIKPHRPTRYIIAGIVFWPLAAILNIALLQPLKGVNSNMLMLESIAFIAMSLYTIYTLFMKDKTGSLLRHSDLRIAVICLFMWSATQFFWATIKILFSNHWRYTNTIMDAHAVLSLLCYLAIAMVLYTHPKMKKLEYS